MGGCKVEYGAAIHFFLLFLMALSVLLVFACILLCVAVLGGANVAVLGGFVCS